MVAERRAKRTSERAREALTIVREPEPGDQIVGLSVQERIIVGNLLPIQGNLLTMRAVQQARESLAFTDEEIDDLQIDAVDLGEGRINYQWDRVKEADNVPDITLSGRAFGLIRDRLMALDKESKLTAAHVPLWEKFVPKSEQD